MNPQYMQQQQHPLYEPSQMNPSSYGELNANLPQKSLHDLHSYPPQKQPLGPPPSSNAPPTAKSPYYMNDIQNQANNFHNGPPLPQSNQNHLEDQISGLSLSGPLRPPSSQNYASQLDKNIQSIPFQPTVNGISNQNHPPPQGDLPSNNMPMEQSSPPLLQRPATAQQQGPPVAHPPDFISPYGPTSGSQFPGQQPHTGQQSTQGPNIPRSAPQPSPPNKNYQDQVSSQNRMPPLSKPPTMPLSSSASSNQQQSYGAPPLQPQGYHMGKPPLGGPPMQSAKPQSLPGPPLASSYDSAPPMTNPQNLSGPPLPGQTLQGSPSLGLPQGLPRPSLPGQTGHLPSPGVPTQQNLTNSLGQQNVAAAPQPAGHAHSQYPYSNQAYGQPPLSRYSPSPSANTTNAYSHMNQHSEPSYPQGFQPPNLGQNMYTNQNQYQSGVGSPTGGYAQSQARRLDPDQMPSPIQVIQDDQKTKGGVFATNQKGLVPPLVTTKFVVEDQGNASPRFVRSTMYTVPTTADIIKQTQIPFALILSPMAQVEEGEYEPPIVDMGELGPVRCNRCKAYMSPFMQFIDAGRRFQCLFCKATTEVPTEYFQHLDHTGQRMDRYERPELILGTYEFTTTQDYCKNNTLPKPPAIIFIIDVSYNTMKSGLVKLLCAQMKKIIRNLPVDAGQTKSNMKVGFITYSNTVQFYNIKSSLAQPQMMVVGDVHDVFMPLLDGFLCDPEESEAMIDSLMTHIPIAYAETRETEIILAPAIQAGLEALKASECSGKLMVFHSSLPIADAPGKLKNRDDRKLLGTDKEKTVIAPQTNFYNNLGQDCVEAGCSVDLFVFNNSYIDIATIGQVCRLTGGEVYKYTYFQANFDEERLITDIINNISRPIAFDAVMRVRTSTGVRPTDFYGHFYMSNTTDLELASIDCDKALALEIKHDDKLAEDEGVYIQAALLYTSCSGIRRLRIINLSLKTSSQMAELYRSCDLDAIINYLSKQSVFKLVDATPKLIKDSLISRCATILASYRKHCATPSSAGQLILPECMKLLPLYIISLLKSDALTGGNGITIDQKVYVMMAIATMPISESIAHVYPRLLPLHDVDPTEGDLPPMLRCSIDKFTDDGAYLLENGIHMFLWLGLNIAPQWVQEVFGVPSVVQVDTDKNFIPLLDTQLNERIRDIISHVQSERRYCMRLTLVRQRDKMEAVMRQFLVEDRGIDGNPGYVDFLCQMHREIRTLLS
ncbi:protein transport protein Sec24C-like [Copidosoma floridanum]|uniref:protein transport protein Sec24C-like n=1 Tax=Copidosoma floridanum TaxID=29053 RepID=UPI0006C94DDD|nr:protein transport protein Sec24C-like [Copidosoma floridanum]XP_014215569.1 protein transport protein Sec24C-like [Copidosoma floridanum]XP_014215577.1 protein transport protein Sec24C-like [Copidosoma floridanum]XP_014215585.1 protein transport protein Sec24C-like [Copidosoma floridanum]XP_014215595.1 protein transport protein Sec24C-like [Copidosoma floridanum]XP_014215604.1 protein transport protein Sec24C-like [Copidosoma floridanum]XP_014215612.1 protein transport protein Sec24C-like 